MSNARRPLAERFWEKVDKSGECWLWTGALNHGYGVINEGGRGRVLIAPRVAWEIHNGPIPAGLDVCHNCPGGDNKACVNPGHLFLGTHAVNMHDASRKGQFRPVAKLTPEQVAELRAQHAEGAPYRLLAERYGIGIAQAGRIARGERWEKVPMAVGGIYGLRRGARHQSAKLTERDVAEIRRRHAEPRGSLAAAFGVTPGTISNIITRATWRHLP